MDAEEIIAAALRGDELEDETCLADAQSDGRNCSDGLSGSDSPGSQLSSEDSLPRIIMRLAMAMEVQNQALWALVEQTAALIEVMVESGAPDTEAAQTTYLDGTRIEQ